MNTTRTKDISKNLTGPAEAPSDSPDDIVRQCSPDIPLNCFSPQALATAAQWFTRNIPGRTLYAVKANPAPYVLQGLAAAGVTSFDAASVAEIRLVRKTCPGAFIAFMHPVKSRQAIEEAWFDHGVRDFSFDSLEELKKIVSVTGRPEDLGLILRLAVPNTSSELPLSDKFGAAAHQAGDLLKAARKVAARVGISFHVGSQTMDPQAYTAALSLVAGVLRSVPDTQVDIIDVGGGFPAAYPGMMPPALSAYRAAIEAGLDLLPNPGHYQIWSEPGRALVAESTSIVVRADLRKGDVLYINDGTYGSLFDAGHMGFRYPVRLIQPASDGTDASLKPFRFYGPTCDSIDYMPGPFLLPKNVREGDYIEIGQLGAYGNAMRTDFNGFSAHEVVVVGTPPLLSLFGEEPSPQAGAAPAPSGSKDRLKSGLKAQHNKAARRHAVARHAKPQHRKKPHPMGSRVL